MREAEDIIGKRFGRLTVISKTEEKAKNDRDYLYKCRCDCGKEILATSFNLKRKTKSCGCRQKELASEKIADAVGQVEDTNLSIIASKKIYKNSKTGVRGVCFISKVRKFRAVINVQGKAIYLGDYDDLDSAAKARKNAENIYFDPILERHRT